MKLGMYIEVSLRRLFIFGYILIGQIINCKLSSKDRIRNINGKDYIHNKYPTKVCGWLKACRHTNWYWQALFFFVICQVSRMNEDKCECFMTLGDVALLLSKANYSSQRANNYHPNDQCWLSPVLLSKRDLSYYARIWTYCNPSNIYGASIFWSLK